MSLIYHGFPNYGQAFFFARACEREFDLDGCSFGRGEQAAAQRHDPFPYELDYPVTHIERPYDDDSSVEAAVTDLALTYGGRFAGT